MKKFFSLAVLAGLLTLTPLTFASGPGDGDPLPPPSPNSATVAPATTTGVLAAILTLLGF